MKRCPRNPILTRNDVPDVSSLVRDVTSVFNPGAIRIGDKNHLLLRVQTRGRETVFMHAHGAGTESFVIEPRTIEILGIERVRGQVFHVYDPRLTRIDDWIYVIFAADTDTGCHLGVARTRDFADVELISFDRSRQSRNGVLFPQRFGGRYARLERPNTAQLKGGPLTGSELNGALDQISGETIDETEMLRNEARIPLALSMLLPTGLLGLVVAAMLAAFISTHDTYLHSWGSIFVQDVVLPFRKRPLSPRAHLWLLRGAIFGVAVFIFIFSMVYTPNQYIAMFFAITGAIFVGGGGSAIIGGLYWKRGSTTGAWAAMLTGMTMAVLSVAIAQTSVERLLDAFGETILSSLLIYWKTQFTGQEQTFIAMCMAIGAYVLGSLLGPRTEMNMDRLLNRGEYARGGETSTSAREARTWLERLGIDREFSRGDRWVAYISIAWPLAWSILFLVVTIWNLTTDVPDTWWVKFWHVWIWVFTGGAAAVSIWFTIGGVFDLRYLFRHLRTHRDDPTDDGRVRHVDDQSSYTEP